MIEALLVCIASSRLKDKVPADAMRSVLNLQYRDLFHDGVLDLGEVWDLLEAQPDFDSEAAGPPLCRFKALEERLGLSIRLPPHLEELDSKERDDLAARCRIDLADLEKMERRGEAETRKKSGKSPRLQTAPAARKAPSGGFPIKLVLVMLLALGSLGVAGYFLWDAVGTGVKFTKVDVSLGALPASDVNRRGNEAVATLTDDGWLSQPEAKRRAHLEGALQNLEGAGIEVLVLRDSKGELAATARWRPGTRQLATWFR